MRMRTMLPGAALLVLGALLGWLSASGSLGTIALAQNQGTAEQPPGGSGLLVFVPPWQEARVPPGWAGALDRNGTIFVSAAHSGNEENVMARR